MHPIRTMALLGLAIGLACGTSAIADETHSLIQYTLTGFGADDAVPYAEWLEREEAAIESVTVEDGTATVMLMAGEDITLEALLDLTNSYAVDTQKDGITFDVGSIAISGKVLADFANVDGETAHNDLVRKIDDLDNVKAWGEKDAPNGQFWIESEGEAPVALKTILDEIGVEPKLLTQYEGRTVDEVALGNLTWKFERVD